MDDSDLAIEQALQRLDSESSDSEVNLNGHGEPGSESCSVDSGELGMSECSMFSNDHAQAIIRRFVMNGNVNRKLNSLQNSGAATKDNSSIASFSTDSDAGAKSDLYCHLQPPRPAPTSRMAVSDTEGSRPRKSHHIHGGAYITEKKCVPIEEFALQLRERLYAVSKDRETMTMKARDLLRQQGLSYEEIMSAQWYDLPEACKYLDVSDLPAPPQQQQQQQQQQQGNGSLQPPPSSHHQLSPLEVRSPGVPALRQGSMEHVGSMRDMEEAIRDWRVSNHPVHRKRHSHSHRHTPSGGSSVFSATSDSGVGGDTWASSEMTTPTNVWGGSNSASGGELSTPTSSNDRLHQYLQRQNTMQAHLPERERMATSAAIALISNSPHPESLSPLPGPTHQHHPHHHHHHHHDNERQRKHMGHHYSSGDDSSSAFTITSQSSTSDLFIPKRPPHLGADSEAQHYHNSIGHYKRPLCAPHRRRRPPNAPSPLTEQQQQQQHTRQQLPPPPPPQQQNQRQGKGDTLIIYTLDELTTPFAKRLGGTDITLKDFKERVFARKGEYRFFFKSYCPDVNMELLEEYSDDETVLPLVQGKIEGRVEKVPQ